MHADSGAIRALGDGRQNARSGRRASPARGPARDSPGVRHVRAVRPDSAQPARRAWRPPGRGNCRLPASGEGGRRARSLSACSGQRCRPALTRLTPSENSVGASMRFEASPATTLSGAGMAAASCGGRSSSSFTPGTKTQSAPASTYRTARSHGLGEQRRRSCRRSRRSVGAFRTKVPRWCRDAARGGEPVDGLSRSPNRPPSAGILDVARPPRRSRTARVTVRPTASGVSP